MKLNTHIVHVVSYYPPHLGGMENCVRELSTSLQQRGKSVEVITSNIGLTRDTKIPKAHFTVSYLKSIEFAHTPLMFSLFFKLLTIPKRSIVHVHISQAYAPEIVFLVCRLRNIPYITHIHCDVQPSGMLGVLLGLYKKVFLTQVLRHAAKIICLSDAQKDIIAKKYSLPKQQMVTLHNGVDNSYFVKRTVVKKTAPILLFVGRLHSQKNLPRLLLAFSLMKKRAQLRIVGEGPEIKTVKDLIKKHNVKNVVLTGRKSGAKLLEEYKNADVFVLPSKIEGGAPLVLLEAMATGLPAVTSNIYGIRELVGNSVSIVTRPSARSFAQALDTMVASQKLQMQYSKRAAQTISKFTWKNTVDNLEAIYKGIPEDATNKNNPSNISIHAPSGIPTVISQRRNT